tara:strand:+ start:1767 stop:2684 length:918 start_codon:yes stop_codon:yes gene_type:complete
MRVLIVSSQNNGKSSFVIQQAESLIKSGVKVEYYWIQGRGFLGYLSNLKSLRKKIKDSKCDLVHAHYGFSGLLSCLQRIKPVITTYHGCDINIGKNRLLSFLSIVLSAWNIFVHKDLVKKIPFLKLKYSIVPCGVDFGIFYYISKNKAREQLNLKIENKYILFSSSFDNEVKNYALAKNAIDLTGKEIELIELKDYSPSEVNMLLNAVDLLLVTSKRETGPMIIKEAMLSGCPVVSSDVGDAKKILKEMNNSYIIKTNDPIEFSEKIKQCLDANIRTKGKERILELGLSLDQVSNKITSIYGKVL